ncbi:hypothetical protein [Ewingella americana]|uniref:Uncharacterized protein n=1 Tax=Ewingella americana TaxID=41202 RepID=A0A502GGN1_9GAMM|nr:hypothetical protein [Ewingella americana]TPG59883.1 hypothetical protein EAH77_15060 [Ewingella americana]
MDLSTINAERTPSFKEKHYQHHLEKTIKLLNTNAKWQVFLKGLDFEMADNRMSDQGIHFLHDSLSKFISDTGSVDLVLMRFKEKTQEMANNRSL